MKTFKLGHKSPRLQILHLLFALSTLPLITSASTAEELKREPRETKTSLPPTIITVGVKENGTESSLPEPKPTEASLLENGDKNSQRQREGRGLLDTIQSFVQTAQTVNKLFGNSNLGSLVQSPIVQSLIQSQLQGQSPSPTKSPPLNNNNNNNNIQHYYPSQQNNIYQGASSSNTNSNPGYYQQQQQQQGSIASLTSQPNYNYNYGGVSSSNSAANTKYENTYNGNLAAQSQLHPSLSAANPNYNRFPVSQGQLPPNLQSQVTQYPIGSNVNKQGFGNDNFGLGPGSGIGSGSFASALAGAGVGAGAGAGLGSGSGLASTLGGLLSGGNTGGNGALLSTLGDLGLIEDFTDLLSFTNVEKVLKNVNKFDSLQCIPRLVCQTIAKRQQDAEEAEKERLRTSTTSTSTTTRRPYKYSKNEKRKDSDREGRLIPGLKIQGVDTALEQVVKFLDLMQLKDWSLYPYLKGAYHGNQVKTWDECADQFSTCPFSEDQLLYYFNNYKGGLFQSFRSDLFSSPASESSSSSS